jgi:hypothetical protein
VVEQTGDPSDSGGGIRGQTVIFGIFASVALITIIAVAAYFLTRTPNLQCDSGDASLNPTSTAGQVLPLTKTFDSIAGAEGFICHTIAYPRDHQGLQLATISATRNGNLGDVIEGTADAIVTLTYTGIDEGVIFEVSPFPIEAPPDGSPQPIIVAGNSGKIFEAQDGQTVTWSRGLLFFQAKATGIDRQLALKVLDSVR